MKKSIRLSIPTTCQEKWESFTPTSQGSFCGSCSKVVLDFSRMNDAEVLNYFKSNSTHTCGRFRHDQLKAYSLPETTTVRPGLRLLKAGFVSLSLLLADRVSLAQIKSAPSPASTEVVAPAQQATKALEETYVVGGTVSSLEDSLALPGVNILLKGTTLGTVSDKDGKFEFPARLKAGDVLVFSFIGLETQEYKVPEKPASKLDIKLSIAMEMSCIVMMGAVAVEEKYEEPKGFQRAWLKIKSIF